MFDPVDPRQSFPALEHGILKYWKEEDIFKRSLKQRMSARGDPLDGLGETAKQETFSFYDGPPFATGLPHYGHLLAGTIKDVIPRYQTMRGKAVERRFGWDCHGLPVEYEVEKEGNFNAREKVKEIGVKGFNDLCRGVVQRYTKEWRSAVERMGRFVDMDFDYRTMDPDYMESIWWVFKALHDKGLIYEGHKPMHVCPRCVTPLSNFEVTQGYKEVTDHSVTAMFELEESDETEESDDPELEFRSPSTTEEWNRVHEIRETALFKPYHIDIAYDPNFSSDGKGSDDRKPGSHVIIAVHKGSVVGTVRIEFLDEDRAALRLFTIDKSHQKKGFGTSLLKFSEHFAQNHGRKTILLHSHDKSPDFYRKYGYTDTEPWEKTLPGLVHLMKRLENVYLLAWTTTPWTLPGNLFLAVSARAQYVEVSCEGKKYIVAKALVEEIFKGRTYEITGKFTGKSLVGKRYKPLFPYFQEKYKEKGFTVVSGTFVSMEDGTGIVHIAPGFGEDDFEVGKKQKVPLLQHVTMEGRFTKDVTDFAGLEVKPIDDPSKTDRKIAEYLKKHGLLFTEESFRHTYPHCWRCDSPLLNYATSSWFVAVEQIKKDMLAANSRSEWVPSHIRDGRFGKWLEGARDWAISRSRFWGTPLPIWRCPETGEIEVIGSRDDLMARRSERFTKITVLRHGESEGNIAPLYQGKEPGTDLTALGKKQAAQTAEWLRTQNVTHIYSSPLARAKQTAEIVSKENDATLAFDERLREVAFGEYEGKTIDFSDLAFTRARRAHRIEQNQLESVYHFPGMETWQQVQERTGEFLKEILPRHRGEHIVLVTHADPLRNILHFFTKEDPKKLSEQPYPGFAEPHAFYWDHDTEAALDLHKETVDDVVWPGSPSKQSVEVTLVRHGETDWNKEQKLQGQVPGIHLNGTGRAQAKALAETLKKQSFDVIVSSPLDRATETAEILSSALGIPHAGTWPELAERDNGVWCGRTAKELLEKFPLDGTYATIGLHYVSFEKGESLSQFFQRGQRVYERFLKEFPGKRVLVVTHGGIIQVLRTLVEHLSYPEALHAAAENTGTVELQIHPLLRRVGDVLDCWFESGSMPYAQHHFPFERPEPAAIRGDTVAARNTPLLREPPGFPADFIAEGIDQTRGWFYTLIVLSAALYGKPAFHHCIVNGIVLAEDGKKMSKRLKNYPEPLAIAEKHGADAVRFALMSSPAVRGEDLRFSEKLVEEQVRSMLLPLWNTYAFFVTYANMAKWEPMEVRRRSAHSLDEWIRAEIQDLANRMTRELEGYDLSATCSELQDTIDALTNWYVRLSRRRFAGKGAVEDQGNALATLYDVLITLSQLLAPFCPFIADAIFLNLVPEEHGSVHLTDWPETRTLNKREQSLLGRTRVLRTIVTLGLSLRSQQKLKVRQPLQKAEIAIPEAILQDEPLTTSELRLLEEELNVKAVEIIEDPASLATAIAHVDARKVGPRLGARVQELIHAGKAGEFTVGADGKIRILEETLGPDEAAVVYRGKEGMGVASDKGIVVSLDTTITEALKREGAARDLIRAIQQLRKDAGYDVTDRVTIGIQNADDLLKEFGELIMKETNTTLGTARGTDHHLGLDGRSITISITPKS